MDKKEIGLKRLAAVLAASMEVQDIVDRDVDKITEQIFGAGVNKDTVCAIRNANRKNPKSSTLQRLAPICFRVKYFKSVNDDPIGVPVFDYEGSYDFDKTVVVKTANSLQALPDIKYRCVGWEDLKLILDGKIPVKNYFVTHKKSAMK